MRKVSILLCLALLLSMFPVPTTMAATNHISVTYQVYDDVRGYFLPNVTDTQDYAGIYGNAISCVYANLSQGNITYKVHTLGGQWLPEVVNRSDYAGIKGKAIDGLMVKTDTGRTVRYRVHIKNGSWLPYVTGYNQGDSNNGYAGMMGKTIDAVQIYLEDATTPAPTPTPPPTPSQPVALSSISISSPSSTVYYGETVNLKYAATPSNATIASVSWTSSNSAVASVDSSTGKLIGKKVGTATITAKVKDKGGKTKTATRSIKVVKATSGATLNYSSLSLAKGDKQQLVVGITPSSINKNALFISNNTSVASVDNNGWVTAKAPGTAIITVTPTFVSAKLTCKITVNNYPILPNNEMLVRINSAKIKYKQGTNWDPNGKGFANGYECYGFARLMSQALNGSFPVNITAYYNGQTNGAGYTVPNMDYPDNCKVVNQSWTCYKGENAKIALNGGDPAKGIKGIRVGDYIRYKTNKEHSVIVIRIDEKTVTVVEGNMGGYNLVNWGDQSSDLNVKGVYSKEFLASRILVDELRFGVLLYRP